MQIKNGKLLELDAVLQAISGSDGGAKLKYAVNLNRTLISDHVSKINEMRTMPVEGTEEWTKFKNEKILEECLKDERGEPTLIRGAYQFDDQASFAAKLERLRLTEFSELVDREAKLNKEFQDLLEEEVSITDFPYVIKWSFVKIDGETGEIKGVTGPQQFVLMSNRLLSGDPPWLEDEDEGGNPAEPETE
jgi:hypothetical protein